MNQINYAAVRAFNRLLAKLSEDHDEARRCDAGFDGGEFSGPAHDEMLEHESGELAERVAARFGMTGADLAGQHYVASMIESDRLVASLDLGAGLPKLPIGGAEGRDSTTAACSFSQPEPAQTFDGSDGGSFTVELEPVRDDTILRIRSKSGAVLETHRWSESLLAQAYLAQLDTH